MKIRLLAGPLLRYAVFVRIAGRQKAIQASCQRNIQSVREGATHSRCPSFPPTLTSHLSLFFFGLYTQEPQTRTIKEAPNTACSFIANYFHSLSNKRLLSYLLEFVEEDNRITCNSSGGKMALKSPITLRSVTALCPLRRHLPCSSSSVTLLDLADV